MQWGKGFPPLCLKSQILLHDVHYFQEVRLRESIMTSEFCVAEVNQGIGSVPHHSRFALGQENFLGNCLKLSLMFRQSNDSLLEGPMATF